MKLEVEMYFRTNDGTIYKNYGGGTNFFGDTVIYVNEENNLYDSVINVDIKKSSFNLIDLIEVGDIVKVCDCFHGHTDEIYIVNDKDDGNSLETLTAIVDKSGYEIKEILTHEQYEANCYKVQQ